MDFLTVLPKVLKQQVAGRMPVITVNKFGKCHKYRISDWGTKLGIIAITFTEPAFL